MFQKNKSLKTYEKSTFLNAWETQAKFRLKNRNSYNLILTFLQELQALGLMMLGLKLILQFLNNDPRLIKGAGFWDNSKNLAILKISCRGILKQLLALEKSD